MGDNPNAWQIALTAILVEGIIFIILSAFKFRETLVNCIPENLKYGITTGIGLFITFIGLQNAGVAAADASTRVALGDIATPQVALALIGVVIIGAMLYFGVKGAILWGILITWVLGIVAELTGWYVVDVEAGVYSVIPHITGVSDFLPNFAALGDTAFKFDFSYMLTNAAEFAVIVFAFLFVDLFDTVGTLIGVAAKGNMLDKEGKLPRVGKALMADAIGTVAGACLGTSTVTSYVESSAGVAEGGRTGLTSLTTAVLFLLAHVPVAHFRRYPQLRHRPRAHHRGHVYDVQRAEGKIRGRYGRCAGRLRSHYHDALHLFHCQRHHVRRADMDGAAHCARQNPRHPPRYVDCVRPVRHPHCHARYLTYAFQKRLCSQDRGAFLFRRADKTLLQCVLY